MQNSMERSHTFNPWVSYDPSKKLLANESIRENRSHAVCKSMKLLDMERFHDSLAC